MAIDPQNGIAANTGIMQLLEVDLAFIDDIKQCLTGQFDELRSHVRAFVIRFAAWGRTFLLPWSCPVIPGWGHRRGTRTVTPL